MNRDNGRETDIPIHKAYRETQTRNKNMVADPATLHGIFGSFISIATVQ